MLNELIVAYQRFLENPAHNQGKILSRISIKNYLSDVRRFGEWFQNNYPSRNQLFDLKPEVFVAYRQALVAKDTPQKSINRYLASLRRFGFFLETAYGLDNPALGLANVNQGQGFSALRDSFRNELIKTGKSSSTLKNYLSDLDQFFGFVFASHHLSELPQDSLRLNDLVLQYLAQLKGQKSQETANRHQTTLKRFFAWASDNRLIDANPLARVEEALPSLHRLPFDLNAPVAALPAVASTPPRQWRHFPRLLTVLTLLALALFGGWQAYLHWSSPLSQSQRKLLSFIRENQLSVTPQGNLQVDKKTWTALAPFVKQAKGMVAGVNTQGGSEVHFGGALDEDFNLAVQGTVTGRQLIAETTTEPPLVVSSSLLVTNLNADLLDGFHADTDTGPDEIPVVNASGVITLSSANPVITSPNALAVTGAGVNVGGIFGSDGDVNLTPDGGGNVNVLGNTTSGPVLLVNDAQLSSGALIQGQVGNGNTGYDFLRFLAGGGLSEVFAVDAAGDITFGGDLESSSVITFNDANTAAIAFSDAANTTLPAGTVSILDALNNAGGVWTDGGSYLYPTNRESVRVYDSGGTKYLDIAHDGTNVKLTTSGTDDIRLEDSVRLTSSLFVSGAATFDNDVTINAVHELRFNDTDNSNYTGFHAPSVLSSNLIYILPDSGGFNNYVLTTNGSGTLSWQDVGSGGVGPWTLGSNLIYPSKYWANELATGGNSTATATFHVSLDGDIQVGAAAADVAYSRFGSNTTTHSLSNVYDVLVSGILEVDGAAYFDTSLTVDNLILDGASIALTGASTLAFNDSSANTLIQIKDQGDYPYLTWTGKSTTGNPATCTAGDTYFNTTDAALFVCIATNTWQSTIPSGGTFGDFWRLSAGAISPVNDTFDVLIGNIATTSAEFAFTGLSPGETPMATFSGNLTLNATTPTIFTTNARDLTLDASGNNVIVADDLRINGGDILGSTGLTRITLVDSTTTTLITGKLGIGTSTPARDFHIYGTDNTPKGIVIDAQGTGTSQQAELDFLTLGDGSSLFTAATKAWHMVARGNAYSATAAQQNDLLLYYWNGTSFSITQSWDSATGFVGIGTDTPDAKLHVASTTADDHVMVSSVAPSLLLANNDVEASATMNSAFALATSAGHFGVSAGDSLLINYGASRGNIYINSNYSGAGTTHLALQPSTGNVGIGTGTTAPQVKLEVIGAGVHFGDTMTSITPLTGRVTISGGTGELEWQDRSTGTGAWSLTDRFLFYHSADIFRLYQGSNGDIVTWAQDGNMTVGGLNIICTDPCNAGFYQDATNGAFRSRTSAASDNGFYFQTNTGAATTMFVGLGGTYNGNVGIGTAAPVNRLQVHNIAASSDSNALFTNGTTGATATDGFITGIRSDNNAYLWSWDANSIIFGTSAVSRMTLSSTGRLTIQAAQDTGGNILFSAANPYITASSYFIAPGGAYFSSGTVYVQNQMTLRGDVLDDGGNLTLNDAVDVTGVLTNTSRIDVQAPTTGYAGEVGHIRVLLSTNTAKKLFMGWDTAQPVAEGAYIQSVESGVAYRPLFLNGAGGTVYLGANGSGTTMQSSAFTIANLNQNNPNQYLCWNSAGGAVTHSGGGNLCNGSSLRFKQNIEDLNYGLEDLLKLRPVSYYWRPDYDSVDRAKRIGLIAEEVEPIIPEVISYGDDGLISGIDYTKLPALTIRSIQQLNQKVETYATASGTLTSLVGYDLVQVATPSAYQVRNPQGNVVTRVMALAELMVAKINVGFISAREIVSPLASIDELKTDLLSPLSSSRIVVDGDLQVNGDATISGTITAQKGKFDTLEVNTVKADQVEGLTATLGEIKSASDAARAFIDTLFARQQELAPSLDASTSAELLAQISEHFNLGEDGSWLTLDGVSADFGTFKDFLEVQGSTVTQDLLVQNTLFTNTIATAPDSSDHILYLQPAGGSIDILGGILVMSDTGDITLNGNLTVNGNLVANNASFGSVSLSDTSGINLGTPATSSASFGKLLSIFNENGEEVASVDASGSANFTDLAARQLIIAAAADTATSSATVGTNATIGTATLPAGQTTVTIANNLLRTGTLIYLTPVSDTANQVLYVQSKVVTTPSHFTVAINDPVSTDITFNYWLVQTNSN